MSYFARWWFGDRFLILRLMNYVTPWLLFFLIPALLVTLLARRNWLSLTLGVAILSLVLTYAPLFLPRPSTALAGSSSLKVMSYNIWSRNRDIAGMTELIRREQPDILLLQEITPFQASRLTDELIDLYPDADLHFAFERRLAQAVISRYPLTPLGGFYNKGRAQQVLAETPQGTITIWNVHPKSYAGWELRYEHITSLLEEDIAPNNGPIFLGGDFNTTDQTEAYQEVNNYLKNAHWEAGWGFGFSFPSPTRAFGRRVTIPSLVRIDHIFYSDHFFVERAGTLTDSGGSDHLPVVAEFVWAKSEM